MYMYIVFTQIYYLPVFLRNV